MANDAYVTIAAFTGLIAISEYVWRFHHQPTGLDCWLEMGLAAAVISAFCFGLMRAVHDITARKS